MDDRILQMADFAHSLTFDDLPQEVVDKATDHILDTLGCAIGGFHSNPARITREVLTEASSAFHLGAVWGEPDVRASAPDATFLNTVRLRYLDFNDMYPGGHPSDMLGALLAFAQDIDGKRFITAMVAAYEVHNRFNLAAQLRERGWDQGYGIGLGTVAGLGNLLGLSKDTIARALSLSAVVNIDLRSTRAGNLSQWKGCATAMANRNAVELTQLAIGGMDGPESPITGRDGLEDKITGPLDYAPFGTTLDDFWILKTNLKRWPVEYHLQAAVWAAIEARELAPLEEISDIDVQTYWSTWSETASEEGKWAPESRETADHSLPFVFIRAMLDGKIEASSFDDVNLRDSVALGHMKKVRAAVNDDNQALFPHQIAMQVNLTTTTTDGTTHRVEVLNPLGQSKNPMDRATIEEKFGELANDAMGEQEAANLFEDWSNIVDAARVGDLLERFVAPPAATDG